MKFPRLNPVRRDVPLQAADSPGGAGAAAAENTGATALATLLAARLVSDGEVVLMILKPSFWFLILSSASFVAMVWVAALALAVVDHRLHDRFYFEFGVLLTFGRLGWAALQWMGRLYILTDMRVLRLSGVTNVEVFDCPLRKVVRTRMVSPVRENFVGVGSIEIIPADETIPAAVWQTVAKPKEVHSRLISAINRARQGGTGASGGTSAGNGAGAVSGGQ